MTAEAEIIEPGASTGENSQTTELSALIELGHGFLETQAEGQRLQAEQTKQVIEVQTTVFKYRFWLYVGIAATIFAIASGIIFYLNDIDRGLSVLSHVGAVVAGLLAGTGLERIKNAK